MWPVLLSVRTIGLFKNALARSGDRYWNARKSAVKHGTTSKKHLQARARLCTSKRRIWRHERMKRTGLRSETVLIRTVWIAPRTCDRIGSLIGTLVVFQSVLIRTRHVSRSPQLSWCNPQTLTSEKSVLIRTLIGRRLPVGSSACRRFSFPMMPERPRAI
jgi:hypothetical protein